MFWQLGFGWTKWLSAFFKKQVLVCRSYFFLLFSLLLFFVAVGLDNEVKPLPFLLAAGFVFFSLAVFHFIPQVVVLLFLVAVWR